MNEEEYRKEAESRIDIYEMVENMYKIFSNFKTKEEIDKFNTKLIIFINDCARLRKEELE